VKFSAEQLALAVLISIGGMYTGAGILLRLAFRYPIDRGEA
jgi:hypothetical protein